MTIYDRQIAVPSLARRESRPVGYEYSPVIGGDLLNPRFEPLGRVTRSPVKKQTNRPSSRLARSRELSLPWI